MRIIMLIILICISTFCQSQTNILSPQKIDSLASYSYGFGETNDKYFFSANYYSAGASIFIGNFFQSARLIAINKQSGLQTVRYYNRVADTGHFISRMEVINDTIHTIRVSLWRELPNNIYHYKLYSDQLNSQLQIISSHVIQTIDDTNHIFYPAQAVLFIKDIYYIANYYAKPEWTWLPSPSIVKYSIYNRYTDSVIVKEQRLNPEQWRFNGWSENSPFVSSDDSGNVIATATMSGISTTSATLDNILVKLKKNDGYSTPQAIRYFPWDSTTSFLMSFAYKYPYVVKKSKEYYFISKSYADYNNMPALQTNAKVGVYKGHFIDSMIIMDTCYNTPRNLSYTTSDVGIGCSQAFKQLVFKNDTILFAYMGNDWGNTYFSNPCQDSLAALEIVALDTNLALLKSFSFLNNNYNASPYGYDFTKDGAIMVYGALCPRGAPQDSLNLFAFLIDFKTGYPLNIFNAEGFINTGLYKTYPNPIKNEWVVEGMKSATAKIIIYDMHGKLIQQHPITDYKTIIDTRSLITGLYFYQIADEVRNIHQSGKILKQE